ncbi:MAG: aminotransferase class I/II-fold pyridoxal phosphate-dependent enzyme [Pseudomonadota bacterium]
MSLFDKFAEARSKRDALRQLPVNPVSIRIERALDATTAQIDGRSVIMAGTNNYLGLTFEAECIRAAQRALEQSGTGTTGSRVANGNYAEHEGLEQDLANFYGYEHGMLFSTGYGANLGTIAALVGPGDCVLLDADAHASLYDACRLSGADIFRFRHNDPESLDKRLRRLGERARNTLVAVEGLYSILGDYPALGPFCDVCERHGALLLVDEAHSLGTFGEHGRGLSEADGVLDRVDFIVGTFSKSLGATGGYCVSRHEALSLFRYTSRPFIFTASPCPSVVASTRAALRLLRTQPERRTRLWAYAHRLYDGLAQMGLTLGPQPSPVVAVRCPSAEAALGVWQGLLERGVYTNLIVPPASPDGSSFIRCSLSAAHTQAQVEAILAAMRGATEGLRPAA